ncbi:MAG: glycosyltransferase family A protein [Candidatus Bathyarchaeota archaeon]|nr:glycosyltransferase family A protein [Candidatus Bathyarchaeota archaeon]
MKNQKTHPLVSIIIPTYNSKRTLRQCLQSIKEQTYKRIETIVVDRHSTDETVQIAKKFKAKILYVTQERSVAKNLGAKNAQGKYLLFLDSDMELSSNVVEECVKLCEEKNFDAAVVPLTTVAIGFLAECRKLEVELYSYDPNYFLMPRFFRKTAFLKEGGFDERLICGEDFDLARRYERQGYRIGMITRPIRHLEGKLSLKNIVLKAHYYGKSLPLFFSKEPALVLRGYCPTRFAWNFKHLIKKPIHLMGLAIIKLIEYIAYSIGIFNGMLRLISPKRGENEVPNFY